MIDFNIEHGYPALNNDADLILQQIEVLFDTTPGEVLGSADFGTRYSDFLYNLQMSNEDIKNVISRDLQSIELFGFTYKIDVNILYGSENDIILVKIEFDRDDYKFDKIIKITQ